MQERLKQILEESRQQLRSAATLQDAEDVRIKALGKKGQLTALMRMMGKIPPEERPAMGQLANTVRANVEAAIKQRKIELGKAALQKKMAAEAADVTLPGRMLPKGTQHLITQIREEIEDIFAGLGYIVADGPYVETTW